MEFKSNQVAKNLVRVFTSGNRQAAAILGATLVSINQTKPILELG